MTAGRWLDSAPEFEDAIRGAAAHHGILPDLVRKDYWVTRVLRALANDPSLKGRVVFKGGTSLSKGWRLIDRFSEDVDILLTGPSHGPIPAGKKERARSLKSLRARIEEDTPLRLPEQDSLSRDEWAFHYIRSDFHCNLRYPLPGRRAGRDGPNTDWLLVEAGFRGGANPFERRPLTSLVADFIETQASARAALAPYAHDLDSFDMDLLGPERTFAEKLLGLHTDMSDGVDGARRVRTRHYYDVARLFERSEAVRGCIARGGMTGLIEQAIAVSNEYWDAGIDPVAADLRASPALNPDDEQIRVLRSSFDGERVLYYREAVTFDEILAVVREIRSAL